MPERGHAELFQIGVRQPRQQIEVDLLRGK